MAIRYAKAVTSFGFEGSGRLEIVARFEGGKVGFSGAVPLRQTDKLLNPTPRLSKDRVSFNPGSRPGTPKNTQVPQVWYWYRQNTAT
jgi:hypothetical protein